MNADGPLSYVAESVGWFLQTAWLMVTPSRETAQAATGEPRGRGHRSWVEFKRQMPEWGGARESERLELAERARRKFIAEEIPLAEFERRLDVLADDDAAELRRILNSFYGIGERTSFSLAWHFESERAIASATVDELKEVPNVGRQRSAAISELVEETWYKTRASAGTQTV